MVVVFFVLFLISITIMVLAAYLAFRQAKMLLYDPFQPYGRPITEVELTDDQKMERMEAARQLRVKQMERRAQRGIRPAIKKEPTLN